MGLGGWLAAVSTVLVLSLVATPTDAVPFNVTAVLSGQPGYAQFNSLLTSTGVATEINARSSLTVLVVKDAVLTAFLSAYPNAGTAEQGDLLRYHVLLQYLDIPELKTITVGNPSTITTLYQTTGRAAGNSGSVNIYNDQTNLLVGQANVNTAPNTTIVTNVTQIPYNISVLEIDAVVAPTGFGAATATANLTAILAAAKNFNTFNNLLQSTGVGAEFAALETGQGITIFAPTDAAFAALPPNSLSLLTAAQTKLVVEYHALTSYYTLGSLTTLNNPQAPTVATTNSAPGLYLLNVSSAGTSGVVLNSGLSQATISSTLYDTPPTVLFAVNTILLPPAIFATAPAPAPALVPGPAPVPSGPVPAPAPLTPTPALSPTPVPAPSPLTPSPTPTPSPSSTPSPSPTPALAPGPPAPPGSPTGSIVPETPGSAPEGSRDGGGSFASSTSVNFGVLAAMAVVSSLVAIL